MEGEASGKLFCLWNIRTRVHQLVTLVSVFWKLQKMETRGREEERFNLMTFWSKLGAPQIKPYRIAMNGRASFLKVFLCLLAAVYFLN